MCRNVVISPVISGPIILPIIAINDESQNPNPTPGCEFGISHFDLLTMGGNARWRSITVGGAVSPHDAHREARSDGRAGHDAGAVSPVPTHSHLRAPRMAGPARVHAG